MNPKLTSIAGALMCAGMAMAAGPDDAVHSGWSPLPELRFADKVELAGGLAPEALEGRSQSTRTKVKGRVPMADKTLFDGRKIYGSLVSSSEWEGLFLTEVPYGVYSFTIGDNPAPEACISDMAYSFTSAAWGRDTHYGVAPMTFMGIINGARHIQIDTKDWVEKSNVMHESTEGTYSLLCCTMAYDPTDDTFYGFRYREDLTGLDWVKVDPATSDYEMLAAYRGKTVVLTLAPAPDGRMYCIDVEGDLYTVDKENGRVSLVGNTGVRPSSYDQSMVWDNRSGSFLWAAICDEGSVLFSVDPETAQASKVMKFRHDEQFASLYITDSDALPASPAAVGRLQLKYSSDGALDGAVSFNLPSKTFSGESLAGNVNLDVWLDGVNLKGVEAEAGGSVSIPVELEEGNHYIAVVTSNGEGWSPMRYVYQYAGYDTPIAPGSPRMEFADGVNTVTWQTPEGGVNKGYVDFDNLTYDVVRMPDGVTVASGISETSFTEPTPSALQAYYYVVTAVNNGHVSAPAETNRVLCGDAFPVPYSQSFEDEATFRDFFSVVDNDGDGNTWRYGFSGEIRMDYIRHEDNPVDADDWLILPKISMDKGVKYRFGMLMKIFTQMYKENFEILIGTDPADLASFRSVAMERDFTRIASEFDEYTCDFLVDEDGDYNLAVRYCSEYDKNGSLLMVRNVSVSKIGMGGAPAKVIDLTVTPDASDLLEATVTFRAPETDLCDAPLTSGMSVSVVRDSGDAPVHVFDDVLPGQELSWTDTEVPSVGLHSYTVVPANEAGDGEAISAEEFIGIYTAPYSTDFSDKKYSRTLWTTESNIDDNDNGWYGWNWTEDALGRHFNCYYFLTKNRETDIWLFSPKFKFEDNTVYTARYNGYFNTYGYPDIEWQIAYGPEASSDAMQMIEEIGGDYFAKDRETVIVNRDGGRYNIGFGVSGSAMNDYFAANLFNFNFIRRASAFAPCRMTDYNGVADKTGELKATLRFKAPATNYYDEPLDASEELTVKIYQGKDATIPAYTTKVAPGQAVEWTDEKALHGFNHYRVTCENSFGPGEALMDTIFVGRDKPAVVENLVFKADADNANVRISWSKPTLGENGGLVLDDETTYSIYAYEPSTQALTLIADNVADKSFLVAQGCTGAQQMYYYAVSAVNTEGEGSAMASSIVLGKPYDLPFAESFANASVSTQLWQALPMVQGATSAGTDNPVSQSYNKCEGPQDGDGGCAYFYNGYQYETMIGALLVSPKVRLDKDSSNELTFWAYHYQEPEEYEGRGAVYVAVSADDSPVEILTAFEVGGASEDGWTEHKVNLDAYRNSNFLSFVFMGVTPGYQDVIYLDNVRLVSDGSGVNVLDGEEAHEAPAVFDLNGWRIPEGSVRPGSIVVRDGRKVILR